MRMGEPEPTPRQGLEVAHSAAIQGGDASDRDASDREWRLGLALGRRSYYLHVRFGTERRSPERLEDEGQVPVPVAVTASLTTVLILFGLFGVFCFLYLLKSMAGIDMFSGESPLHPIYALIFE